MPLPPFFATALPRTLLVCGGAAAALGVGLTVYQVVAPRPEVQEAPICVQVEPPVIEIVPAPPAPAPVLRSDVQLVFTAGGESYLKLADVGNREVIDDDGARAARADGLAMPRHGAARHAVDDYVQSAIAPVALRDVPMLYASWLGRSFRVDAQCEASIVGFAVVSRVTGEPGYASVDAWTGDSVLRAGQPVLAAKLDGCKGTLARDASLSPILFPEVREDAALEASARDTLLRSALAAQTQRTWAAQLAEYGSTGPAAWTAEAEITTKVLRHPTTGKTFVSAQAAVPGSCGSPEANIWALYEVTDAGLREVVSRAMSEIQTIEQLVDIDGDGTFELVGTPWINNEQVVVRASGERLESLATPFFGCPC